MNMNILYFITYCIGIMASSLNMDQTKVYNTMKMSGILDEFIIPCYDSLHTFGQVYLIETIKEIMIKRGVISSIIV